MVILQFTYFISPSPYGSYAYKASTQQLWWGLDSEVWWGVNNKFFRD